jgi:DnaJ-class molecular chaperone
MTSDAPPPPPEPKTRTCGVCYGAGGYMDQYDEDRRPVKVRCDTCKGKGVVPV